MSQSRTATLVQAPPRAVTAALIELIAPHGTLLDQAFQLASAESTEVTGTVADARFAARCSLAASGTELTLSLDGVPPHASFLGAVADAVHARAPRLAGARIVVGAAIVRDGLLLAQQRDYPADHAGRWELAGGRVEPGETDEQAVRREIQEELGVLVEPGGTVGPDVVLTDDLLLRVYRADLVGDDEPAAREHRGVRWLAPGELDTVDWLPADRVFLPALRALLAAAQDSAQDSAQEPV